MFTIDIVFPFGVVGFLAKISRALADEGISILSVSAYSNDHILVKERDFEKTIKVFENLGFNVEEK